MALQNVIKCSVSIMTKHDGLLYSTDSNCVSQGNSASLSSGDAGVLDWQALIQTPKDKAMSLVTDTKHKELLDKYLSITCLRQYVTLLHTIMILILMTNADL
jgi:hypothetical protein